MEIYVKMNDYSCFTLGNFYVPDAISMLWFVSYLLQISENIN